MGEGRICIEFTISSPRISQIQAQPHFLKAKHLPRKTSKCSLVSDLRMFLPGSPEDLHIFLPGSPKDLHMFLLGSPKDLHVFLPGSPKDFRLNNNFNICSQKMSKYNLCHMRTFVHHNIQSLQNLTVQFQFHSGFTAWGCRICCGYIWHPYGWVLAKVGI